ncbi:MAG: hypothetical protein ACI85O_000795 [Saprospiraceae bacterium]|jgi:hypothetical protein
MKKYFLFTLLSISFFSAQAQIDAEIEDKQKTKVTANLNVLAGIPLGLFQERQPETGLGFGGNMLFEVRKPIAIGFDITWQRYDRDADFYIEFDEFSNPFDIKEEINNNILNFNGLIHIQPEINFFLQPYIEGTFGVNRFHTKTVFTDVSFDEQINVVNNHSDWAVTYGGAVGIQINVWRDLLFLDLKCAYRVGNTAEYYTRIEGADFTVPLNNFELKISPTNMIMPQIGVTFLLSNPEEYEEMEEEYYEEEN